jgi:hypothetical protein
LLKRYDPRCVSAAQRVRRAFIAAANKWCDVVVSFRHGR